jgi:hypothetical protein
MTIYCAIHFINPDISIENKAAYIQLVDCWSKGFGHVQASELIHAHGFHVPNDQYVAFCTTLDITLSLEIGERQEELGRPLLDAGECEDFEDLDDD